MKKRLFALVLAVVLLLGLSVFAFAKEPCVIDGAELLTEEEAGTLEARLTAIANTYSVELAVVTVNTCDGTSHREFAKDTFLSSGYGFGDDRDGVLLLIDMDPNNRGWYIYGRGLGAEAVDDGDIDEIGEQITPDLKAENYADAFMLFASECEDRLDIAVNGAPFNPLMKLVICLAIGFVIALIVTGVMRGQLKSVHSQRAATDYVRKGSMNVTESRELFLYSTLTRREKPKSSGSSGSGGGVRESGGGGSF